MFKLDLEKAQEPEIKLPTSTGSLRKQESSRKTATSALLTMSKPLTVWITTCGKFFMKWEYQSTLPVSWEICMQVRKQQFELDMEQQTCFQIGKVIHQGCVLSSCLFNLYAEYIMQNARLNEAFSWNQAGVKIAGRNINKPQTRRWHHPYGRKRRRTKEPFVEGERGEWKIWLKTQHSKN